MESAGSDKCKEWRFSYGDDQILFNYGWFEHDRILCLGLDPAVSADLFGKSKAQEGTGRPKIALLGGVEEPVWLQAWLQLESTKQLFAHIKSREPPVIRGNGAPESDLPGPGSEHRKSGVGLSAKSKAQKEGATPAKKALKSLRRGWLRGWLEEIQERSTKEPVADKDPHEPPVTRGNGGPGSGLSGPSSKHSELGVWPADRRAHARNPKVRNAGSSYKQKLALRGEMDKNPNQSSHFPVALADLQEAEVQEGAEHIVAATEVKTSGGKQSLSAVADKSADLPETIFFTALKEFQSIYADLPNDTRRILALSKGVKLDPQLRRILTDLETDL